MSEVEENLADSRFELAIDGSQEVAAAYFQMRGDQIVLTHTIVPERFAGRGIASKLARGVLDEIRASNRKVVLVCPFMSAFYASHPEYADIVVEAAPSKAPA
jgi:predicted GNAT family acetyltransferase